MNTIDQWLDRIALFWWYDLPLAGGRISRGLKLVLSEGLFWSVFPRAGALLPLIALIIGLAAGWLRFGGANIVFTQSPVILILALVFGFLGGQLGLWFVIGFGVGESLLYAHPYARGARDFEDAFIPRSSFLIAYIGMGMLAVGIPVLLRSLRAQLQALESWSADLIVILDVILSGLVGAAFTFIYLQALPILVRPVFTWNGSQPTVDSMFLLQEQPWIFAIVAFVVIVVRVLLEYGAAAVDPEPLQELADGLDRQTDSGLWERIPRFIRIVIESAIAVVLLAGLLTNWTSAIIPLAALVAIGIVRWLLSTRVDIYTRIVSSIPAILRIVVMFAATYLLSSALLQRRLSGSSFEPIVTALLVSAAVAALLFPEPPSTAREGQVS